jgi:hypothetical protein
MIAEAGLAALWLAAAMAVLQLLLAANVVWLSRSGASRSPLPFGGGVGVGQWGETHPA